jgi:catechol 2,3-dioxygenase-like lactoylglutathione lyase family enzyme
MAEFYSVAPVFAVADVGATIRWYEEQLGFSGDPFPPQGPYLFAIVYRDKIEIMLQRVEGYQKPDLYNSRAGGVWDAYFRIEGVKDLFESVRDEATIVQPLRKQPYGQWEFEVADLNGYVLVFSEPAA